MKKLRAAMVMLVLLMVGLFTMGNAQQPGQPRDVSDFMKAKLIHMQKVLEGITTENHDLIRKHSNEIKIMSMAAEWRVFPTPDYQIHSAEFRRTVDTLTEAAKKRNLDGAALAYVGLTMKCVSCHKYVRSVRISKHPQQSGLLR